MRLQDVASCPIVEPSQLGSSLHTLNIVGVALDPSRFAGCASHVDFGDVAVEIVRTSPALLIERVGSGRAGCLLMLEGAERAKWDGRSIDRCDVAALMPETTLMGSFQDPFATAFVSTGHAAPEAILGSWAWMNDGRVGLPVRRSAAPAHARLATCVREIERVARYAPDVLQDGPSRTALRASLVGAMQRLGKPAEGATADRTRSTRRRRIVSLVDEYLCANPMRPVYTDDLCQALGISASAMHSAFQDVFGISPHRYLKLRRMSLVRVALLSPSGPWQSVKAAALSYGFWHLGQFAQDYRDIYGELPSATLARSGGGAK